MLNGFLKYLEKKDVLNVTKIFLNEPKLFKQKTKILKWYSNFLTTMKISLNTQFGKIRDWNFTVIIMRSYEMVR